MTCKIFTIFFAIFLTTGFLSAEEIETTPSPHLAGFTDIETMRKTLGLSLGASRVYERERGFAVGGYLETLYQNYSSTAHWEQTNLNPTAHDLPTGKDDEFALQRAVLFMGYRINDRWVVNSELRIDRDLIERGVATFPEHYGTTKASTEASLDLAYVDYIHSTALTFRAGVVLVPMGLINEFHQPTEYLGARSGFGDIYTIPSNWSALGFGILGRKGVFNYRAYVVSGLNAAEFNEFGWRDGREISFDTIGSPAFVFRIDYNPFPGGVLGGSYYIGDTSLYGLSEEFDLKARTVMMEIHGELKWKGAFTRAQYAKGLLSESADLNRILEKSGRRGIGSRVVGGYVEGGWNFLWHKSNGTMIMPYMRGEASNPQDALPGDSRRLGLRKNWFVDFIIWTMGVEVRPVSYLSIKTEYVNMHDQNQIFWNEFHIGGSFTF